jgi:serine phosphatase RsbU (regulator of sigma subunit)
MLHMIEDREVASEQEEMTRELALAGSIQRSFIPDSLPRLHGWDFAALLVPALETAGDFYDIILLPENRWGFVIADVAGKGMGAALYMAMCRTLLRVFAEEYPTRPDLVMAAANQRMLADARAGLFVTAFLGVLDPDTGVLWYSNAGHNPPCLLPYNAKGGSRTLVRTGMALGVEEGQTWERRSVHLKPGDALILYTDGITEARNPQGEMFGFSRMARSLSDAPDRTAESLCATLMQAHGTFATSSDQEDDISLVILVHISG